MRIQILILGFKGLTTVNALSLKFEKITNHVFFSLFHSGKFLLFALLGSFTDHGNDIFSNPFKYFN